MKVSKSYMNIFNIMWTFLDVCIVFLKINMCQMGHTDYLFKYIWFKGSSLALRSVRWSGNHSSVSTLEVIYVIPIRFYFSLQFSLWTDRRDPLVIWTYIQLKLCFVSTNGPPCHISQILCHVSTLYIYKLIFIKFPEIIRILVLF